MARWPPPERTHSAFARMRRATNAWDVLINPNNGAPSKLTVGRPAEAARASTPIGRSRRRDPLPVARQVGARMRSTCRPILVADREATYTIGRPVIVAGRQPAADDPNGVWVDRTFASRRAPEGRPDLHLHADDADLLIQRHRASTPKPDAKAAILTRRRRAGRAHIDGIGVTSDGVVVDPGYTLRRSGLTPAFRAAHAGLQTRTGGRWCTLKPGTDLDSLHRPASGPWCPHESIAFQRAAA